MDEKFSPDDLADDFLTLIGEPAFLLLLEECAGCRLYIPANAMKGDANTKVTKTKLTALMGIEAASKLIERYAGCQITVPLVREYRAERYRLMGLSNSQIALRLGLHEKGVERLFARRRRLKEAGLEAANCNAPIRVVA